jgi:solute carrier family 25 citrate transporter 1
MLIVLDRIEDGKRPQPRYRGLIHGSVSLVRERGIGGIYRGLAAVTMRQGANSAVRMGSYNWLKGKPAFPSD